VDDQLGGGHVRGKAVVLGHVAHEPADLGALRGHVEIEHPRGRDEMLALIRRIGTDFGISVLVTSHLLGELERICDHVIVIDGGRLLRSSAIAEFTQATQTVTVEVEEGTQPLAERLSELGHGAVQHGRLLLVKVTGPETFDAIRDAAVDLDLCLIRLEQGRHRIEDVFREEVDAGV
jgi:ABC-2 type transport system ATP-binding protein